MDENENIWREVRKNAGKITELETTMNIEIPALKTGISDLKNDMKDGFKGIGDKLDKSRTREADAQIRGHRIVYGVMLTAITILIGLAIRLAMAGGS